MKTFFELKNSIIDNESVVVMMQATTTTISEQINFILSRTYVVNPCHACLD